MVAIKIIALLASAAAVLAIPHDGHHPPHHTKKTITITVTEDCPTEVPPYSPTHSFTPIPPPPTTAPPPPTWSIPTTGCAVPTTTTYTACEGHDQMTCPPVIACAIIEETTWSVPCVVPDTTSTVTGCTSTCQTGCATVTSTITVTTPPSNPSPPPPPTSVTLPTLGCSAPLTTTTPPCEGFDIMTCPPQLECLRLETTRWSVPCVGLSTSTVTRCQSVCETDCPTSTQTITVITPGA